MKLKRVIAWGLVLTMALGLDFPSVSAASPADMSDEQKAQYALAQGTADTPGQLPGTKRTFFREDSDFRDWFNVSGYVAGSVQDRSEYYDEYVANGKKNTENYVVVEEDGYWEKTTKEYITKEAFEKLDASAKANYRPVTAEEQFVAAFTTEPRVIQVNAEELELGCYALPKLAGMLGPVSPVSDYGEGEMKSPQTSPVLMETGVSDLNLYSHLTIFSTTGCVIRHAGFDLGGCNDVIIRNFRLEGMYEWDEPKYGGATFKHTKRFGWCNVSLNDSDNIWVDHCTFGFAFDGNLDIKNGSSVSVTWCQFGVQDISTGTDDLNNLPKWQDSTGSELWKNILYMEECYQAYLKDKTREPYAEYTRYRDAGATPEQILRYAAYHSKVHLCGSGEKDFYTNVDEKITLGFNYYTNIIQRIPMIRSGNGHMYNCIVDNADYQANAKNLSNPDHGHYLSVNNARNGATIGTDTCIFNDVTPCCGVETQGTKEDPNIAKDWVPILNKFVNHNLVVNSRVTIDGKTYEGSSWDNFGDNLFNKEWTWNDKSSIGDFKWSKWKSLEEFRNEGPLDTNKIETKIIQYSEKFGADALYNNFYDGADELDYAYQCFELNDVKTKLRDYGGARKNLYNYDGDETVLDYIQPYNSKTAEKEFAKKVTINVNGASLEKENNTYYVEKNKSISLPTAEEMKKVGYDEFLGWQKYIYDAEGNLVKDGEASKNVTITGGATYEEEYYVALWKINVYEIRFNTLGGNEINTVLKVEHNQQGIPGLVGFPAAPTKENYVFAGWYTYDPKTETYQEVVDYFWKATADTCLYAKWNNKVTFDTDGGTEIAAIGVESGKRINVNIPDPTKEGCTFEGWYTDRDYTKKFDFKKDRVSEPMTLYAKWNTTATTVKVTFDTDGGTEIADVSVESGNVIGGDVADPVKEGYTFEGWYTDKDYTTKFDLEKDIVSEPMTLFAKWRRNVLLGDVDGSGGNPNVEDALAILKYVAEIEQETFYPELGDVDGSGGNPNVDDALTILKYVAEIIDSLGPQD